MFTKQHSIWLVDPNFITKSLLLSLACHVYEDVDFLNLHA